MADHRVEGAEALKVGKSLGMQSSGPECLTVTDPCRKQLSKFEKLHNTIMGMNEQALALFKERCPDVWEFYVQQRQQYEAIASDASEAGQSAEENSPVLKATAAAADGCATAVAVVVTTTNLSEFADG